jgi:hypothetical protein
VTCAVKELNPDRPIQSNALPIELTGRRWPWCVYIEFVPTMCGNMATF